MMVASSSLFNPVLRRGPSRLSRGISKFCGIVVGCVLWIGNSVAHGQFWAPPDSLFKMGRNLVRFNPAIINAQYFCDHPWQPEDEELRMKRLADPNIDPATGYIIPNAGLINHTAILSFLTSLNVKLEPMWMPEKDPCLPQHRIKITRWGDTLAFPYWCSFIAHFPDTISPVAFGYYLTLTDYSAVQHSYPLKADTVYSERGPTYDPYYTSQPSLYTPPPVSPVYGLNAESAWDITSGIPAVRMGCLDQGFDAQHEDFWHHDNTGMHTNVEFIHNYSGKEPVPSQRHGLFVSGIMAALRNNRKLNGSRVGIAGVAGGDWENGIRGPKFYFGKINYGGQINSHIQALDDFSQNLDVRVINMSYGNGQYPQTIYQAGGGIEEYLAFARAYRAGAVITNSVMEHGYKGNTDPVEPQWQYDLPSGYSDQWILGIGSHRGDNGALSHWCSWGGTMRLLAPGSSGYIYSLRQNNTYDDDGNVDWNDPDALDVHGATSWAAPHAAGVAALILSRNPNLLNDDVAGLMEATARKSSYFIDQEPLAVNLVPQIIPFDKHTGFGMIDAGEAVRRVPDVMHGFVDVESFTESEHEEKVRVDNLDGRNVFADNILMFPADTLNDPFPKYSLDSSYAWSRIRVVVRVTIPDSQGRRLDHVWGVGMGHGIPLPGGGRLPNTTGWENGPIYRVEDENKQTKYLQRWCSETPYAKVDPLLIDRENRSFTIFTHVYRVRARSKVNGQENYYYLPAAPDKVKISYGYLLESPVSSVDASAPAVAFSVLHVRPNPLSAGQRGTIRFSSIKEGRYVAILYNALGERVLEPLSLGLVSPGIHDIPFEPSKLLSGNYFCRITSVDTGESVAKSFVVTN